MSGATYSPKKLPGVVLNTLDVPSQKNVDVCAGPGWVTSGCRFQWVYCPGLFPRPRDVSSLPQEIQPSPCCLFRPSHLQVWVCQRDCEEVLPVYNAPFRTLEWLVTLNPLSWLVRWWGGGGRALTWTMDSSGMWWVLRFSSLSLNLSILLTVTWFYHLFEFFEFFISFCHFVGLELGVSHNSHISFLVESFGYSSNSRRHSMVWGS